VDYEGYDIHSDKEFQEFAGAELSKEIEFYEGFVNGSRKKQSAIKFNARR